VVAIPARGSNQSQPASFIGEEFDQLDYLQKSTVASGLNEMNTEAAFQGRARFTAPNTETYPETAATSSTSTMSTWAATASPAMSRWEAWHPSTSPISA